MPDPTVITIGNFDGVHRGHQALLHRARQIAHSRACRVVALTFEPHPIKTLRPGEQPLKLSRLTERMRYLREGGADRVEAFKPTPDILGLPPREFMDILLSNYAPIAIVEGEDFHFGKNRTGDMGVLGQMGQDLGFKAVVEPKVTVGLSNRTLVPVSSTLIRWLVQHGRVLDATLCMGRPFELVGQIVKGDQVGRTLDVPTCNLNPEDYQGHVIPEHGVYAGHVRLDETNETYPAAISVGVKPTFQGKVLTIEAHLLGFDREAYGEQMTVQFRRWIRDQVPFKNKDVLRTQLHRDITRVEQWERHGLLQTPRPSFREQQKVKS